MKMHPTAVDVQEAAYGCRELWLAAIRYYAFDAGQGVTARKPNRHQRAAINDLVGSRRQLRRLCAHLEYDADFLGDILLEKLTAPQDRAA